MKNTAFEQLELGMNGQALPLVKNTRTSRMAAARWWFGKMRQVVDLALPSRPTRPARPEQTYLRLRERMLA